MDCFFRSFKYAVIVMDVDGMGWENSPHRPVKYGAGKQREEITVILNRNVGTNQLHLHYTY